MNSNDETLTDKELLDIFYKTGGSYTETGKQVGLSRQRIHQRLNEKVDPERLQEIREAQERDVVDTYLDTGSYAKTVEQTGLGYYKVREIVTTYLSEEEIAEAEQASKVKLVYRVVDLYKDQAEFLQSLEDNSISSYVREGLGLLLGASNFEKLTRIKSNMASKDNDMAEERGGFTSSAYVYVTEEQAAALERYNDEYGRGAKAAALRAAIDYKREYDAARNKTATA